MPRGEGSVIVEITMLHLETRLSFIRGKVLFNFSINLLHLQLILDAFLPLNQLKHAILVVLVRRLIRGGLVRVAAEVDLRYQST